MNTADQPLFSHLMFQPDSENDGLLMAGELYCLPVGADLVVYAVRAIRDSPTAPLCPVTTSLGSSVPCFTQVDARSFPVCGMFTTARDLS